VAQLPAIVLLFAALFIGILVIVSCLSFVICDLVFFIETENFPFRSYQVLATRGGAER
jgi:hypothetical protein